MDAMTKVEVLRAACCVSGVDGEAGAEERPILEMLAKEVGVGDASLGAMMDRAVTEPDYYESQFRVLKAEPLEAIKLLFSVALADRKLSEKESNVLSILAKKLDVTDDQFQQLHEQAIKLTGQ